MYQRTLLSLLIAGCCLFSLSAQVDLTPERFAFEPNLNVNPAIQTPAAFLGYELGEEFTVYARSVAYFQYLAEQSPRITIHQYGETYERKPLFNLVISSEDNQSRMEDIRTRHLALLSEDEGMVDEVIANDPVFTSFSYNIHGNEASSTEAAMQVAYRLAAAQDERTQEVLQQSVILMYICINPDGRDRYVYWYNGMRRATGGEEPRDLEHYAPWPNGRTNHYWFDLNRDWVWQVHPESQGHSGEYQRWMPQVHVDYHEQGYDANYFTTPGTTPRNLLLPDDYERWTDVFGRANIAEFDQRGLSYFTRDRFDFFYPGYGSSYPSVMGAIGMLTEQGGIAAGRAVETDDGYVLTLRQRIFDHYTTSWATIRKAAENRAELLRYSRDAWSAPLASDAVKTYIIRSGQDRLGDGGQGDVGYLRDFVNVLLRNGVEVEKATSDFSLRATGYQDNRNDNQNFGAGDLIIRADQSRRLFIETILGRNMAIEDSVMYDMATWSAPLAYNLDAYTSRSAVNVATEAVTLEKSQGRLEVPMDVAIYAYAIDWSQRNAPRALAQLWEKGYRVRAAIEPFSDFSDRSFSAGSLIVLRGRNMEKSREMSTDLRQIAEEVGVKIVGFSSGRMKSGYDLASSRNEPIKRPKVAMLIEQPFSVYTAGQVYYLFDWETQLPVERIRTSILNQTALPKFGQRYGGADLHDYDVLILPGGGGGLNQVFGKKEQQILKNWLAGGGTLVALESAATFFSERGKFNKLKIVAPKPDTSEAASTLAYAERERYRGLARIPGSALAATIDTTHPLGFGLKPELYTIKFGSEALANTPALQSVGRYATAVDELLTAGYASRDNLATLAGQTFAGVLPVGRGQIVYLLDNPHYRMFWRGPSRMMQNAVMLLPGL